MRRLMLSLAVGLLLTAPASAPALAQDECVRNNDACVNTEEGTASVDVGAVDAEASDDGASADAGAIDAEAGTDGEACADAGAINAPPSQRDCPPE